MAERSALGSGSSLDGVSLFPTKALIRVLLPGCYAWLTTVALPVWDSGSFVAMIVAVLAVGALAIGVAQREKRPSLSRRVGILGFLGLALGAWSLAAVDSGLSVREPLRSAVGAVAWGIFAMGWGGLADRQIEVADSSSASSSAVLTPRQTMPRRFWCALAVVALASLALPIGAWWIENSVDGLLAHLLAAGASIALVSTGVQIVAGSSSSKKGGAAIALLSLWVGLGVLVEYLGAEPLGLLSAGLL